MQGKSCPSYFPGHRVNLESEQSMPTVMLMCEECTNGLTIDFCGTLADPGFEGAVLGIQGLSLLKCSLGTLIFLQVEESYTAEGTRFGKDALTPEKRQQLMIPIVRQR